MATSRNSPRRPIPSSLSGDFSSSRAIPRSILLHPERERWTFPTGQGSKRPYGRISSSYLLQELMHRRQQSDAEGEDQGEDEEESEESSESEMLDLEVCLPAPTAHPLTPFSNCGALLLQQRLPDTPLTSPRPPSFLPISVNACPHLLLK